MAGLDELSLGLSIALTPGNLLACFAGTLLGTVIGVLPGVGPVTTIALLLPLTFSLPPTAAMIMLAGIYYGAQYGGSIIAILVNVPGEASSAITCVDGYEMARQGRARSALAVAALSSFAGGTVGTLAIAVVAAPLSDVAARFDAADYTGLIVFGLAAAVATARGSIARAVAMTGAGLLLGAVGTDVATGRARWTFGIAELFDGIGFIPLAIGLFALAEIIATLSGPDGAGVAPVAFGSGSLAPDERRRAAAATSRGTVVGSVLGALPGGGPVLASFAAYAVERSMAARRGDFGRGAVEGVAAPEAANNAAAQTSFVPLLTLGLPSNAVVALLLGALVVHGVQPGPAFVSEQQPLFWGLVASMWIGNVMLLALNLPLIGTWAKLLRVPYVYLYPATIVLSCAGIYAVNHSVVDLWLAALFGVVGYLLRRGGFEPTPLLLGFILSRPLEENVHRALVFSGGDATTFVTHPLGATLMGLAVVLLVVAGASRHSAARL